MVRVEPPPREDSVAIASATALHYVDDRIPGFSRRRRGKSFTYLDPQGSVVRDRTVLERIASLAIPPAYEDIWICPIPNGHLQATGRDARGRKQYRYHKRWHEVRDAAKFRRSVAFAKALPALRRRVMQDISAAGLHREKVVAVVVWLLDRTLARIGNREYARDNDTFGITTLRTRHVKGGPRSLRLMFRGKSGVKHSIGVSNKRVAAVIRRCVDLPGQELFEYLNESGDVVPVKSDDVNAYVREATGEEFSAKDFRTWHGTVLCASELAAIPPTTTTAQRRRVVSEAVKSVAQSLRNTPAVTRSAYVHPAVIDRFMLDGELKLPRPKKPAARLAMDSLELSVMSFLEREERRDERAMLRRDLRRSLRHSRRQASRFVRSTPRSARRDLQRERAPSHRDQ